MWSTQLLKGNVLKGAPVRAPPLSMPINPWAHQIMLIQLFLTNGSQESQWKQTNVFGLQENHAQQELCERLGLMSNLVHQLRSDEGSRASVNEIQSVMRIDCLISQVRWERRCRNQTGSELHTSPRSLQMGNQLLELQQLYLPPKDKQGQSFERLGLLHLLFWHSPCF